MEFLVELEFVVVMCDEVESCENCFVGGLM